MKKFTSSDGFSLFVWDSRSGIKFSKFITLDDYEYTLTLIPRLFNTFVQFCTPTTLLTSLVW